MGYRELTNIDDALNDQPALTELSARRAPLVQQLIDDFINFYGKEYKVAISAIDDLAIKISSAYFSLCYTYVKPVIKDKTNRFKMASLMELIIVKEQVLFFSDDNNEENRRKLNAFFGMTAAFSLINCMISDATQEFFCNTINAEVNKKVHGMLEDHQQWLETKPLNDMPVFINAQFYESIELIHAAPFQINGF